MKSYFILTFRAMAAAALITPLDVPAAAQSGESSAPVEVLGGTASFETGTNIPAISVHGKSTELRARAQVRQTSDNMTIERVEATVPVKSITTGMGLRDDHMRKYIFTTSNGQVPDVTFAADRANCAVPVRGESTCKVSGELAIRGTSRPFTIALKVSKNGAGYKAIGDGAVMLSAYGIQRPSQLGVTTTDDVKLHLEFIAKTGPAQSALR